MKRVKTRGVRRNMSWLELGSRIMKLDGLHEVIRNVARGATRRGMKWYAYRMTEVNKYGGRQTWGQFIWVPKARLIGHLEVAPPGSGGFIGHGKPVYHSVRWERPHPLARTIKEVWDAHIWGTYHKGKIRRYGGALSVAPEFAHWLEAREVAEREGRKIQPYKEWRDEMSEPFHSTWWRAGRAKGNSGPARLRFKHLAIGDTFVVHPARNKGRRVRRGVQRNPGWPRQMRCDGCGRKAVLHQRVDWPAVRRGGKYRAPWYCTRCVPQRRRAAARR